MSGWEIVLLAYVVIAVVTFVPVLRVLLRGIELNGGGPWISDSHYFSEAAKQRLSQNYQRMLGTLVFWKRAAARYRAFHIYSLIWITISSVLVPVLAQAVGRDSWSKWFLSIVGAHAALLLAWSRAFKVESSFKAFRQGESDFYDLYRQLLDSPLIFGRTEEEQLATFFARVAIIRQLVRSAEIDNFPSIEGPTRPVQEGAGANQ